MPRAIDRESEPWLCPMGSPEQDRQHRQAGCQRDDPPKPTQPRAAPEMRVLRLAAAQHLFPFGLVATRVDRLGSILSEQRGQALRAQLVLRKVTMFFHRV